MMTLQTRPAAAGTLLAALCLAAFSLPAHADAWDEYRAAVTQANALISTKMDFDAARAALENEYAVIGTTKLYDTTSRTIKFRLVAHMTDVDATEQNGQKLERDYRRALSLYETLPPTEIDTEYMLRSTEHLAGLYYARQDYAKAIEMAQNGVNIVNSRAINIKASKITPSLLIMAKSQVATHELGLAKLKFEGTLLFNTSNTDYPPSVFQDIYASAAELYRQLGNATRAQELDQLAEASKAASQDGSSNPANQEDPILQQEAKPCMPNYAREARLRGQQGTVEVKFSIDAHSNLTDLQIIKSSGFKLLDQGTVDGLVNCRFRAAIKNQVPIDQAVTADYIWKLAQ